MIFKNKISSAQFRGFTLLEIMIAMAIFAIINILAYAGYNQLIKQTEHVTNNMRRVRAIQLTMIRFTQDFAELEARPVREPLGGGSQPALLSTNRGDSLVELTRAGWSNPAAIQRSTMQRVVYRLVAGTLYRDHWAVLDPTLANEAIKVPILEQVRAAKLRFMDRNRQWREDWPGAAAQTPGIATVLLSERPIAVEITLELEDWGTLTRLIEVPG